MTELGFEGLARNLSIPHQLDDCSLSKLDCTTWAPVFPYVLPQDVQYSDIDYMERQLDFTLSPKFAGLPALIDRLKADGMRVILILVSPVWMWLVCAVAVFHGEGIRLYFLLCCKKRNWSTTRIWYSRVEGYIKVQMEARDTCVNNSPVSCPFVVPWLWFPHLTCALLSGPSHFWQWDAALPCLHSGCGRWCLHQVPKWWRHCLGKGMT